jgi:anti-sigma regulatory factor (Ser/Thr protein kinase)
MEQTLQYECTIQQIARIQQDIASIQESWKIPSAEIRQVLRVIEELFALLINNKGDEKEGRYIDVKIIYEHPLINFSLSDTGEPFNPFVLNRKPGSAQIPSEEQLMGITLIKTFVNSFQYTREGNKNVYTFSKEIKSK